MYIEFKNLLYHKYSDIFFPIAEQKCKLKLQVASFIYDKGDKEKKSIYYSQNTSSVTVYNLTIKLQFYVHCAS